MADKKISELPTILAAELADGDQMIVNDLSEGAAKKIGNAFRVKINVPHY